MECKRYNKRDNIEFEIKNGNGKGKEYDNNGKIIYEENI